MRHSPKSLHPAPRWRPSLGALSAALAAGLLLSTTTGCEDRSAAEKATAVFYRYQDALFAGDRKALRRLLSVESREIVAQLPLQRVRDKQRLEVIDTVVQRPEVLITVRDPNRNGAESHYVVVKERGELVLDLLATTAYNHIERATPGGIPTFSPNSLPADEIARIRSRSAIAFR